MRALLDTNIIIHREGRIASNQSIGTLYHWLDKLRYEKVIHPYTEQELRKADNPDQQELYDAKLSAYTIMGSFNEPTDEFNAALSNYSHNKNDLVDNQLLFEVYDGRVDLLITEDQKMHRKARDLGISDRVLSIDDFITKCSGDYPDLITYKALSVRKRLFGQVNLNDTFFDSLRNNYNDFDKWFKSKCDEEAYVCLSDEERVQGFLYIKTEDESEVYSDITPTFEPRKRLKIGTFKTESTGFRLGERFIKIVFDNAIKRNVEEIYVTFYDTEELSPLKRLFLEWGFIEWGEKIHSNGNNEQVLIKRLHYYDRSKGIKWNFPNIDYEREKRFLPIEAKYHTPLLPDSKLKTENEVDFLGKDPQKYALEKVYISFSYKRDMKPGDILLIYRKGVNEGKKAHESVVSTIGIIDECKCDFTTREEYLDYCDNRTIFTKEELNSFWNKKEFIVIKFIYVKNLNKNVILKELWDNDIVVSRSGPRPFDTITDKQFEKIISLSNTELYR